MTASTTSTIPELSERPWNARTIHRTVAVFALTAFPPLLGWVTWFMFHLFRRSMFGHDHRTTPGEWGLALAPALLALVGIAAAALTLRTGGRRVLAMYLLLVVNLAVFVVTLIPMAYFTVPWVVVAAVAAGVYLRAQEKTRRTDGVTPDAVDTRGARETGE